MNREDEGKLSLETSGTTGPTTQRHIPENCGIQKHRALTSIGRYRCDVRAGSCDYYIYLFIYLRHYSSTVTLDLSMCRKSHTQ